MVFSRLWRDKLEKKNVIDEQAKSQKDKDVKVVQDQSRRGYMHINGSYHPVVLRDLLRNFSRPAFEKDMTWAAYSIVC